MPVSKHRHPGKRIHKNKPPQGKGLIIKLKIREVGASENLDELAELFHDNGLFYWNNGVEGHACGNKALSRADFVKKYELSSLATPNRTRRQINHAQHDQYLDGYNGADYRDRVIINAK